MAEFDISAESFAAITGDLDDLAREQKEQAVAAEALADAKIKQTTGDLALASERQKQIAKTSAEQSISLEAMTNDMGRIEEIRQSPFLRMIEPIAGRFSENFSRRKLTDSIQSESQTLKISSAKDELQASVLRQKSVALKAELDVSAAEAAAETQDVTSLAMQLRLERDAQKDIQTLQTQALLTSDPETLAALEKEGVLTKRQVTTQTRAMENERIQIANARMSEELNKIQFEDAKIGQMTPAQLNDNAFIAKSGAPIHKVRLEKQRRAGVATAFALSGQAAQAGRTAAKLGDFSDNQLKAIADSEAQDADITSSEAEMRLIDRKNKQATSASSAAKSAREAAALMIASQGAWLTNSGRPALEAARDSEVNEDGTVTVEGPNGEKIPIRVADINAQLGIIAADQLKQTLTGAASNATVAVASSALDQASMAMGLPVLPGASMAAKLKVLSEGGNLTPEEQDNLSQASSLFEAADKMSNPDAVIKARQQGSIMVQQVNTNATNRAIAGQPALVQEATRRMIVNGGIINTQTDAITLLSTAAVVDTQTVSPAYNQASNALRISALSQDPNKDRATSLAEEFSMKKLTPLDRIEAKTLEQATQHAMGVPIVASMASTAYAAAASALGNEDLPLAFVWLHI